jgi:hypothetical protein
VVKMKVKSKSGLEAEASDIFDELSENYRPCEVVYILSELARRQSLAMLQREQEAI